jgi:hypothetical protein
VRHSDAFVSLTISENNLVLAIKADSYSFKASFPGNGHSFEGGGADKCYKIPRDFWTEVWGPVRIIYQHLVLAVKLKMVCVFFDIVDFISSILCKYIHIYYHSAGTR